jgi:hypothetical protein
MRKLLSRPALISLAILFLILCNFAQIPKSSSSATGFGGECPGAKYEISATLKTVIAENRKIMRNPCDGEFCDNYFAYDLNRDRNNEYFVRLGCGATGNCVYGIFSDNPAKLLGKFEAWFFYVEKGGGKLSRIKTYTREGGNQGVVTSLSFRSKKYVQTSERTEHGYSKHPQPFLEKMGYPKCP